MQSFSPTAVCFVRPTRSASAAAIGLVLSFALLLTSQTAAAQGMKLGVVDVQRAVMQSEDGLRAQATLKKLFDSRQQELTKRQSDLQKQKDDIDRQKNVLSQQALQKKADEWQKEMVELQSTFVEYNKELEKKQKELTDPIFERVIAAIKRVAGLDSYDVIVDRATVAFARTDLDLTDRVVQMANGALSAAPGSVGPVGPTAPAPHAAGPAPAPAAPAKP
jgi:outer membrane protein